MSINIVLPDMTKEEAQAKHEQLKGLLNITRSLLLEMRDRKGYIALGFSSFEEYGESEFGYSKSYIHRIATAAHIQNALSPIGDSEIPEGQLRPLNQIPDADKQDVWNQAIEKAKEEGKKLGARHVEEAVNEYKSKLKEAQSRISFLELNHQALTEQNDKLRNDVINTQRNANTNAKSAAQAEVESLSQQLNQLKADLDKERRNKDSDVNTRVKTKLATLENEINTLESRKYLAAQELNKLNEEKLKLDEEVGALSRNKEWLNSIRNDLASIISAIQLAKEEIEFPPVELFNEWSFVSERLNEVSLDIFEWIGEKTVNKFVVIDGGKES